MHRHLFIPRFAFLYLVASAVALGCAMTYSWIANLGTWQTVLLVAGCLIGAWATVFTVLGFLGVAQTEESADEAFKDEPDPYGPRSLVVEPPTGEPYPHHEDHVESAGFDQGQLTSRLTGSTPFVDIFQSRRPKEKPKAVR